MLRVAQLSLLFSWTALFMAASCGEETSAIAPSDDAAAEAATAVTSPAPTTPAPVPTTTTDASDATSRVADAGVVPISCPTTATAKAGETTETITVGGATRTFVLHVPPGYTGKTAVPVVFDFHPLGSNMSQWKLATGWSTLADQKGFIVVVPQGHGDSWNVGRCCDPAIADGYDDVAFVRAVLDKLSKDACINPKRVYATGCSNGGGMSYRLACDAADVIAAVAPVDFDCLTGATNSPSCGNCNPARPISVAQFRATLDPLAPYAGGPTIVVQGIEFPGAQANFKDWATRNACSGPPAKLANHSSCDTYSNCGAGTEITLCTVQGGLHCTDYLTYGTAKIAWEMFERQAIP